jgi:hypothetical protein
VVHSLKLLSCGVQLSHEVLNIKASQFSHLCCVPSHNHPTQARLNTPIVRPGQQVPPRPTRRAPAHLGTSSQSRRALITASQCVASTLHACMIAPRGSLPLPLHTHISCNPQLTNINPFPNPFPTCRAPRGAFTHRRCRSATVITGKPQALKVRDSSLCLSAVVLLASSFELHPLRLQSPAVVHTRNPSSLIMSPYIVPAPVPCAIF